MERSNINLVRVPLNVVVTETGHVTEGVLVAVLIADLDALCAEVDRLEAALRVETVRAQAWEAKAERLSHRCSCPDAHCKEHGRPDTSLIVNSDPK